MTLILAHPILVGFSCTTEFRDIRYLKCYSKEPNRLLTQERSITVSSAKIFVSVLAVQMYFTVNLAKG